MQWNGVDPYAASFAWQGTYVYMGADPVNNIDPSGGHYFDETVEEFQNRTSPRSEYNQPGIGRGSAFWHGAGSYSTITSSKPGEGSGFRVFSRGGRVVYAYDIQTGMLLSPHEIQRYVQGKRWVQDGPAYDEYVNGTVIEVANGHFELFLEPIGGPGCNCPCPNPPCDDEYDPTHGEGVASYEDFITSIDGLTYTQVISQRPSESRLLGLSRQAGGPAIRYVRDPVTGKILDMRHVLVLGFKYNLLSHAFETAEGIVLLGGGGGFDSVDYRSNQIGMNFLLFVIVDYYDKNGTKGWSGTDFAKVFDEWITNPRR